VRKYGVNAWPEISQAMVTRNIRQCRDRWNHYLSTKPAACPWTDEEDQLLHRTIDRTGPRWKSVQPFFPMRSEDEIRNRWSLLRRESANPPSAQVRTPIPIPICPPRENSFFSRLFGSESTIAEDEGEMDFFYSDDW
jgi:hypothetical protein